MISHLDAIRALVPADIPTFDTDVTDDDGNDFPRELWPERYVIFRAPTFPEVSKTVGYSPDVDGYVQAMYCGLSTWQARSVSERTRAALHRQVPVVEGFRASLRLQSSTNFDLDRERRPHIYYATDHFRYRATPI